MLAARPKSQRFLEAIQILLAFVSVCAVVEATRIELPVDGGAGYHTGIPRGSDESTDRRLSDLARAERKRREAEQQANRRGFDVGQNHLITQAPL